ncbi:MAG: response regulator transcription factor [Clostridia bacterium]|nr:response regulator transcription factor [Clostridia bacterium]
MDKILIIEDDEAIAALEADYLRINSFECDIAFAGDVGLSMALKGDYSLVIIDIMLPFMDGFTVLTELRKKKQIPVIMLSAKSEDIDKIRGLGLGADDYMTKPFSPNELVARVKAHINRYDILSNKKGKGLIKYGELTIDTEGYRVYFAGKPIQLTVKEFELLKFLASNPNRVFSKDVLFDRIWGMDALGDVSTVTVHIQRIRDKIGNAKFIETVYGVGYRFIGC